VILFGRSTGPLAPPTGTCAVGTDAEFSRDNIRLTAEDLEEICLNTKRIRAKKFLIARNIYIPCLVTGCGHYFKTSESTTPDVRFVCQHHSRGIQTRESCGREYESSQAADTGIHFQENQFFNGPFMYRRRKGPGPFDKNAETRLIIRTLRIAGDNVRFDMPLSEKAHWYHGESLVTAHGDGDDRDLQFFEAGLTAADEAFQAGLTESDVDFRGQVETSHDSDETLFEVHGHEVGLSFIEAELDPFDAELESLYHRLRLAAGVGVTDYHGARFKDIPDAEKERVRKTLPPAVHVEFERLWNGWTKERVAIEAGVNAKTQASRLKTWTTALDAIINQSQPEQAESMVDCFEKCFQKMPHSQKVELRESGGWFLHLKQKQTAPSWLYLGTDDIDKVARAAAIRKHCRKILDSKDPDTDAIIDRIDAEFAAARRIWVAPMSKPK
jgi:hypothetical protein